MWKQRIRKKKKKHPPWVSFLLHWASECASGWGVGVNWYMIELGGPGPTHTPFLCTNKLTPPSNTHHCGHPSHCLFSPFLVRTAAQRACVNTLTHWAVSVCVLTRSSLWNTVNWVIENYYKETSMIWWS